MLVLGRRGWVLGNSSPPPRPGPQVCAGRGRTPPPPPTSTGIGCHRLVGGRRNRRMLGVGAAGCAGGQVLGATVPLAGCCAQVSSRALSLRDSGGVSRPLLKPDCPLRLSRPRGPALLEEGGKVRASGPRGCRSGLRALAREGWARGASEDAGGRGRAAGSGGGGRLGPGSVRLDTRKRI